MSLHELILALRLFSATRQTADVGNGGGTPQRGSGAASPLAPHSAWGSRRWNAKCHRTPCAALVGVVAGVVNDGRAPQRVAIAVCLCVIFMSHLTPFCSLTR